MKTKYFCANCGREVPPQAVSCPGCLRQFTAVRCPQCGFEGEAKEFSAGCPACGHLRPTLGDARSRGKGSLRAPRGGARRALPPRFYLVAGIGLSALVLVLLVLLLFSP
jgi:DNA-directed RNA polymerase subunit RPC12/RpoP